MFGLPEVLILMVLVALLFGAGRLPELLSSVGRGVRAFRDAASGVDVIDVEVVDVEEVDRGTERH